MRLKTGLTFLAFTVGLAVIPAAAQDDVTITVWDNFTRDVESEMIEALDAAFTEATGINVLRETYTTDDLALLLPRELSQENGPDVAMVNQGLNSMGAMVQAGLLLPLNGYADDYDWWSRYGEGLHARNSVTEDGTRFGSGNLYGVSTTAEVVGVFYNKSIFEELGISVPTTWEELESNLATIAASDYTAITFGNVEGWPGIHTYGAIAHVFSNISDVNDFIFRNEGATFVTEGNLNGANQMLEWVEAGYFSNGFEGLDNDNGALSEFISGQSAMWLAGSWNSGGIAEALGEDAVGFFILPSASGEEVAPTIGGVGLGYAIRATTANPDAAAAYVDFITSADTASILLENGFLPAVAADESELTEGTLTADMVAAWNTISAADRVGHYFDWVVPDMGAYIQEMLAGAVTPEAFLENVQASYEEGQP